MKFFLRTILSPFNALRTTAEILFDGTREVRTKIKFMFAGGPISEFSEYFQLFVEYVGYRTAAIRERYLSALPLTVAKQCLPFL